MSEDEGHSQGGASSDGDDDSDLVSHSHILHASHTRIALWPPAINQTPHESFLLIGCINFTHSQHPVVSVVSQDTSWMTLSPLLICCMPASHAWQLVVFFVVTDTAWMPLSTQLILSAAMQPIQISKQAQFTQLLLHALIVPYKKQASVLTQCYWAEGRHGCKLP